MDQAYQNFNAGKFKDALNNLSSNPSNIDSYEPNLIICEYLANRCQPAANNCLRKLNELIARKFKRDQPTDLHTQNVVKLNLAVLLILQGRKEIALLLIQDVYSQRDCFVEFMQSRIFVLLMELHNFSKNPLQSLTIHRYYLLKATEQRGHSQQWASLIQHEHGKTFTVAREEFQLMNKILTNQALLQLGAPYSIISTLDEEEKLREELIARAKRRKNVISKYYETNLSLINRFNQAFHAFYGRKNVKCLYLMNYTTISEEFDQMPTTKIITNIVSAFANNNAAIVYHQMNMSAISIAHFNRAKSLLTKACTGVEDKDLHLLSLNYGSNIDSITFNQALALLGSHPKQSYKYFESIRKSNQMSRNHKFWYRMAQSILQNYHAPGSRSDKSSLQTALNCLSNAMYCLDRVVIPSSHQLKNLTGFSSLQEEHLEGMIMKMKTDVLQFKHSTLVVMCYVSLGLGLWRKVIRIGQPLIEDKKLSHENRVNVLHYVLEAQSQLGKNTLILRQFLDHLQAELSKEKHQNQVLYVNQESQKVEESDCQTMFYHQLMRIHLSEGNTAEAYKCSEYIRQKQPNSLLKSQRERMKAMHLRYNLDNKFMRPYLRVT